MKESLGTISISQEYTNNFAQLSGDFNPLHVDPVSARRLQFGNSVAHGMGVLFRCLDHLYQDCDKSIALRSIKADFHHPVMHGDTLEIFRDRQVSGDKIEIHNNGQVAHRIVVEVSGQVDNQHLESLPLIESPECVSRTLEESVELDSSVDLIWNPLLFEKTFRNLYRALSDPQFACLLALTNIVGMKCPGMNSVFLGFQIAFTLDAPFQSTSLAYRVEKVDKRFSLVNMSVKNSYCEGKINAIFRPKKVDQQNFVAIRKQIRSDAFTGQSALIIGGSRGIGEITAKIFAAGGGYPVITYVAGEQDALNVKSDVISNGGRCDTLFLDVLDIETGVANALEYGQFSHVYYFASPTIRKSDARSLDEQLLQTFMSYYVGPLFQLAQAFARSPQYKGMPLTIFSPSSIFLDERPAGFEEYCIAKAAMEECCLQMRARKPEWTIRFPRLPMILTDQTSAIGGLSREDSVRTIADILLD